MRRIKLLLCTAMAFFTLSLSAQDWANLNRFKDLNEKVLLEKNRGDRIVFMGNSITEIWLKQSPDFFNTHLNFINRGISGQTTPQMVLRFRQDVIDLKPRAVVILAGTNDIAGNTGPSTQKMITDNIETMCELAVANQIEVILCSILPAKEYPWKKEIRPAESIVAINQWIESYAKKRGFIYVDYHTPMATEELGLIEKYTYDGVHPTAEGYAVMEPLILDAINKLKN